MSDDRIERLRLLSRRHATAALECAALATDRLELLRDMHDDGWSTRKLAAITGLTPSRIAQLLKKPTD